MNKTPTSMAATLALRHYMAPVPTYCDCGGEFEGGLCLRCGAEESRSLEPQPSEAPPPEARDVVDGHEIEHVPVKR